jgi:hypothetical protein
MISCSSTPFTIIIPKIEPAKTLQINNEVKTETLKNWLITRQGWKLSQWLEPTTGYITGGNVSIETVKSVKVSQTTEGNINFFLEVDKTTLNRFINDQTELNFVISIIA